jgi:hypothetical protein
MSETDVVKVYAVGSGSGKGQSFPIQDEPGGEHISVPIKELPDLADCRATYDGIIRDPQVVAVLLLDDHFTLHVWVECAGVVIRAFFLCNVAPRCSRLDGTGIESRLLRPSIRSCSVGHDVVVLPFHGFSSLNGHGCGPQISTVTTFGGVLPKFAGRPVLACDRNPAAHDYCGVQRATSPSRETWTLMHP